MKSEHTSALPVSAYGHLFLDLRECALSKEEISKFGTLLVRSVSPCLSPVPGFDYGHQVLCPLKGKGPILLKVITTILPLENEK
jgi:hypothetical protein